MICKSSVSQEQSSNVGDVFQERQSISNANRGGDRKVSMTVEKKLRQRQSRWDLGCSDKINLIRLSTLGFPLLLWVKDTLVTQDHHVNINSHSSA
jgi:hypothetical protein